MRKDFFGRYVFVNNEIIDMESVSARDILEDTGWMRDYKVFEVMEARGNVVFHLGDHIKRLAGSMYFALFPFLPIVPKKEEKKYFKNPQSPKTLLDNFYIFNDFLGKAVRRTLDTNGFKKSLVWIYVTGGKTFDGFHIGGMPNLYILASKFSEPLLKKNKGVPLIVSYYTRQVARVKNTNYFAAETILMPFGDYNCEVLHCDGSLARETSKANFFIVKNGKIITPFNNILLGVTRKIVIELARKAGFDVQEGDIDFEKDVKSADEVFITSTTKGVWPVVSIEKHQFEIGQITMKLRKLFYEYRKNYFKSKIKQP